MRRLTVALSGIAVLVGVVAVAGLGAGSKFGLVLLLPDHARVGRPVTVRVRAAERLPRTCQMRLVAIAPGVDRQMALDAFINGGYSVMGTTGFSFHRLRPTPRLGFLIHPRRVDSSAWTATATFPRSGRWQVAVPNWCAEGYATPLPALRAIRVR